MRHYPALPGQRETQNIKSSKIMKKRYLPLMAATALFTGCAGLSDASNGALLGGGLGALAGQAIGHNTKSTLIGAGIGTALGYGLGNERDKKRMQNEIDYLKARR